MKSLPSSCTASIYTYQNHLFDNLYHLHCLLDFYGKPQYRRLCFDQYCRKKKAMYKICERITNGNKRTLVAFGNAGFSSTSRGFAPGPVKEFREELRKHCKVIEVDEFRTSQLCSKCSHFLTFVRAQNGNPIWSVK